MAVQVQTEKPLGISATDLKNRLEAGDPATILDVRGINEWEASGEKIQGDIRVEPAAFKIDDSWSKDNLAVAYCT